MVDNKPISIASDHAGFALKSKIIDYLTKKNIPYNDLGTYSADSVDYPDYAFKVADSINKKIAKYAILICNTGLGMSIAANRFTGIRAALCADDNEASSAKKHNNANVLVLSAQKLNHQDFSPILGAWLGASFEKGRHERRVNKIENLAKI
ncbi:MAG: ribose 5-phosphate isomerase B [SAR324 cluster bacterium]|nr:ribose 5-phosphate isomerase B [SAR324 cluster bacterium]